MLGIVGVVDFATGVINSGLGNVPTRSLPRRVVVRGEEGTEGSLAGTEGCTVRLLGCKRRSVVTFLEFEYICEGEGAGDGKQSTESRAPSRVLS